MVQRVGTLGGERLTLTVMWMLAVVGCLLGLLSTPSAAPRPDAATQILDLLRALTTTALAIVIVLGPGLALRNMRWPGLRLGFLPLPGMGMMAATGVIAWVLSVHGWPHPRVVSAAVVVPLLAGVPFCLRRPKDRNLLSAEEWRALIVVGGALGLALARSLWSLGPSGQLFPGTIYQTLEVGDRPDSRISDFIPMLAANGNSPYGPVGASYYLPYTFSTRGPLAGLAATPLVMVTGARPAAVGTPPWLPFDPQGFMAYRLIMITFAATSLMSLWTLTRRLAGSGPAQLAVLLAATTPFLIHEFWFTWPKLLAASLVLLAATQLIDGRSLIAGLLLGCGFLCHPLAPLSLPPLLLIALWPLRGARLRRPRIGSAVLLVIGFGVCVFAWRLFNGSHYNQAGFLDYVKQVGIPALLKHVRVTVGMWVNYRLVSIGNTLLPLRLFLLSSQDQEVNTAFQACFPLCHNGGSPTIVHFFFQYWTTVPFGFAIVFFPMLVQSLWRSLMRWPWAVIASVIVPFAVFAVYWGESSTGMLREGLHTWVLTLLAVVAVEQGTRKFSWFRRRWTRAVLAARAFEVLLASMLTTVVTERRLITHQFWLTDGFAVILMVGLTCGLAVAVWRWRPPEAVPSVANLPQR